MRSERKRHVVDTLGKCEADPLTICIIARLYLRTERARQWLASADSHGTGAGPDLDGSWLKFESQRGIAVHQEDVIVQRQAAEPSHSESWQPSADDNKNGGKSAKEISGLVATALRTHPVL